MTNMLAWISQWYARHCDGRWEYAQGVHIETLDNPGWVVEINLADTPYQNRFFKAITIKKSSHDWCHCIKKEASFYGYGDPSKLEQILELFKEWVESPQDNR